MAFGIYAIEFPDNKIYIGSTIQSFAKRKRAHFVHLIARNHNNYKMNALVTELGHDVAEFKIIEQIRKKDMDLIIQREKFWIEFYAKTHVILNVAEPGGLGGQEVIERMKKKVRSKEIRKKMSDKAKARIAKEKSVPVKQKTVKGQKYNVKTNPKKGVKSDV